MSLCCLANCICLYAICCDTTFLSLIFMLFAPFHLAVVAV